MKSLKKTKNSSVKQPNSSSNLYNNNYTNSAELINSSSNELYQIQNQIANNSSMSPVHMRKGIFNFLFFLLK
jgi:hypothetical protein